MPKPMKKTSQTRTKKALDPERLTPHQIRQVRNRGMDVTLTLSKYGWTDYGAGHFIRDADVPEGASAHPSFAESLVPFSRVAEILVRAGIPLGSKIKFTAKVVKEES